jgi:chemotaxis protein MotA
MDFSLLIGIITGLAGVIVGYTADGGSVGSLFKVSGILIVFVGTIGAVIASNKPSDVLNGLKSIGASFSTKNSPKPEQVIEKVTKMADMCRKEGLLKLQELLNDPDLNKEDFLLLKEGMVLALGMKSADEIREAMESDIEAYTVKKKAEIEVFEGAGGFSPTMGVIGTVMGLVQALGKASDSPKELTEAIAVAFVATLYGVVFANFIYFPCANKLKSNLKRQTIVKEMMVEGMCMIASGVSSRDIENKLSLYYQAFPNGAKKYRAGIDN